VPTPLDGACGGQHFVGLEPRRQGAEEEEESFFSGANAVNEEDPERDRATQV